MNFEQVKKWEISNGDVAEVKINNKLVWEKPRKIWINDFNMGPPSADDWVSFTAGYSLQYSSDGKTWTDTIEADNSETTPSTSTYTYFIARPHRPVYIRVMDSLGEVLDSGDDVYKNSLFLVPSTEAASFYEDYNYQWQIGESPMPTDDEIKTYVEGISSDSNYVLDANVCNVIKLNPWNLPKDAVLILGEGKSISGSIYWDLNTGVYSASSKTITVQITDSTSRGWGVSSDSSWITSSVSSGSGTTTITLTISQNTSSSQRSATLQLKSGLDVLDTVSIVQYGKTKTKPSWNLTSTKEFSGTTIQSTTINVSDPDNAGWSISRTSGASNVYFGSPSNVQTVVSGTGSKSVTMIIEPNGGSSNVSSTITLKESSGSVITSCTITIKPYSNLSVSSNTVTLDPENSSQATVNVTSTKNWTVSKKTASDQFSVAKSGNTIKVTSTRNNLSSTSNIKLGEFVVSDGTTTETIEVIQSGVVYNVTVELNGKTYTVGNNPSSVNSRISVPLGETMSVTCTGNCNGQIEMYPNPYWTSSDFSVDDNFASLTKNGSYTFNFAAPSSYNDNSIDSKLTVTYGNLKTEFYFVLDV